MTPPSSETISPADIAGMNKKDLANIPQENIDRLANQTTRLEAFRALNAKMASMEKAWESKGKIGWPVAVSAGAALVVAENIFQASLGVSHAFTQATIELGTYAILGSGLAAAMGIGKLHSGAIEAIQDTKRRIAKSGVMQDLSHAEQALRSSARHAIRKI